MNQGQHLRTDGPLMRRISTSNRGPRLASFAVTNMAAQKRSKSETAEFVTLSGLVCGRRALNYLEMETLKRRRSVFLPLRLMNNRQRGQQLNPFNRCFALFASSRAAIGRVKRRPPSTLLFAPACLLRITRLMLPHAGLLVMWDRREALPGVAASYFFNGRLFPR